MLKTLTLAYKWETASNTSLFNNEVLNISYNLLNTWVSYHMSLAQEKIQIQNSEYHFYYTHISFAPS